MSFCPVHIDRPIRVAVLGSTGSVGKQALDVISTLDCRVVLLSAGANAEEIARQARVFHPEVCTMESEAAADSLRDLLAGEAVRVYGGSTAVCEAIRACRADVIIHSIAGLAGLPAALAAAETGARIGMANKEAIIAAGDRIFERLRHSRGELIPVDSEHSAIFQCLTASGAVSADGTSDPKLIKRILLTASGGPFFGYTRERLAFVTPKKALAHPTWMMGPKITVDCATLMNKGFEVIEAVRLFHVPEDKVEVLVHRQSIIHSMVEYIDNSVIAQLAQPDMRSCVRYAISHPTRVPVDEPGLDFTKNCSLTFDKHDTETFPLLDFSREVIRRGGCAPTALIAADEVAVASFLRGEIRMTAIADVVRETLSRVPDVCSCDDKAIFDAESYARQTAAEILVRYK